MKLLLFDIDGTLLTTEGAARRAFEATLHEVYGTAGPIDDHPFAGKTDPQIARELLTLAGLSDVDIDAGLPRLWEGYLRRLEGELEAEGGARLMPGVLPLLERLEPLGDRIQVALLTGNIEPGARVKLRSAGLGGRFPFGAFGSDDERRERLPEVAVRRAREQTGVTFRGSDVVVLGDTPYDVSCGRGIGCRAAAVATGPYDVGSLADAGADVVWETLENAEGIVDWILDGSA